MGEAKERFLVMAAHLIRNLIIFHILCPTIKALQKKSYFLHRDWDYILTYWELDSTDYPNVAINCET